MWGGEREIFYILYISTVSIQRERVRDKEYKPLWVFVVIRIMGYFLSTIKAAVLNFNQTVLHYIYLTLT